MIKSNKSDTWSVILLLNIIFLTVFSHSVLYLYYKHKSTAREGFWNKIKKPVNRTVKQAGNGITKGFNYTIKGLTKEMKKMSDFSKFLKKLIDAIPDLIKKAFFIEPIKAIPNKNLRNFFYSNVDFKKDLGTVVKQILLAIIKAVLFILILIPILIFTLGPFVLFVLKSIIGFFIKFITMLFTKKAIPPISQPFQNQASSESIPGSLTKVIPVQPPIETIQAPLSHPVINGQS